MIPHSLNNNDPKIRIQILKLPHLFIGYYLITENGAKVSAVGNNVGDDCSWKLFKSSIPYLPEWTILRPFISETYLTPEFKHISAEKMVFTSNNLQQLGCKNSQITIISQIVGIEWL